MRNHIQNAHEILGGSTAKYSELLKSMDKEIASIRNDKKYSDDGKAFLIREAKKDFQEDLMKLSKQIKVEYQLELAKAKEAAAKIMDAPVKAPDEKSIAKYKEQVEDLRTKVMLSMKPESAKDLVKGFADILSDPYFANQFKQDFAGIITPLISSVQGTQGAAIKHELSGTYEKLSEGFLSDAQKEARQVLESAENMANSRVFNYTVLESVKQNFGREVSAQVNDPDAFFAAKDAESEDAN